MRGSVGCLVLLMFCGACEDPVRGAIDVRSAAGDAYTFTPTECLDGGELGYWGVQLRDEDGRVVDVFERADVPHAIVYAPGRVAFELNLESCEVFEGRLKRRSVNGHGTMRGNFSLECAGPAGQGLAGDVTFEDCGAGDDDDDGFEDDGF